MDIKLCRAHAGAVLSDLEWEIDVGVIHEHRHAIFGILVQFFAQDDITVEAAAEKIQAVLQTDQYYYTIFGAIQYQLKIIDGFGG